MAFRSRRRTATYGVLAVACAASVATGAFTGVGSAAPGGQPTATEGRHEITKTVATTCPFADPIGSLKLGVAVTATLPNSMTVGKPGTIDSLAVSFSLPRAAAQQLLGAGRTLEGGLTFRFLLEQGKVKDDLAVPTTVAATALPAEGDLPLVATGKLPAFSPAAPGAMRLRLSAPKLALGPANASPDQPAEQVACTADGGQDLSFGSIPVLAATAPPAGKPAPEKKAAPGARPDAPRKHSLLDEEPPLDENVTTVLPLQPNVVDTRSTLVRTGARIHNDPAALINGVWVQVTDPDGFPISSEITGELAFTPVTVSYLGYGFLPTTATVEFLPVDYRRGKLLHSAGTLFDGILRNHLDVMSRLSDVKVNGVPLDAGPDCVTETPISIDMIGEYDPFGAGGVIGTDPDNPDPKYRGFTLPPFKNCGVAEKLSSLFTGQNSGPGNQASAHLTLIQLCTEPDHQNCPPVPPIPAEVFRATR